MLDVNGQAIGDGTLELVKFAETASAVNEITVTNAATTTAPEIAATGDDTDIDLKLTPKGAGKLNLDGIKFPNADGSANQVLKTDGSGVLSFTTLTSDGTADWDTSVKTTGFTATANKGYFCNTTSAGFTVTLPATPSAGDEVIILDYAGTFDTKRLIISPNGNKIEGATDNLKLSGEREGVRLVYIDSTQGWLAYSGINEGTDALEPITYSVDFLCIAGGGGGGGGTGSNNAGGGGAGGYRNSFSTETSGGGGSSESTLTFNPETVYTITVGAGGTDGGASAPTNGANSSISGTGLSTITSTGGGAGGEDSTNGSSGGSGGGGGYNDTTGGAGTANQGFNGGNGVDTAPSYNAGGGGGAGQAGSNGGVSGSGDGGNGLASSITGSSVSRAGGGGGGSNQTPGSGGTGGGGDGSISDTTDATNGSVNTGSGGGGAGGSRTGGSGGKGVVIIRMATSNYSGTTTGSPTVTTDGSDTVIVFNDSGSITG